MAPHTITLNTLGGTTYDHALY